MKFFRPSNDVQVRFLSEVEFVSYHASTQAFPCLGPVDCLLCEPDDYATEWDWTEEDEDLWLMYVEYMPIWERDESYDPFEPDYEAMWEARMEARFPDPGTDTW